MNNFSIFGLIRIALQHSTAIILTALVFGLSTFLYCQYFAIPKYSATGSVLVTNGAITSVGDSDSKEAIESTDISASLALADTIIDVLNTNDIYKELADSLGNNNSYILLKDSCTVTRRNDTTLFIDVTFTSSSKSQAITILNTYLDLAPSYVSKYIPNSTATVTTTADAAQKTFPRTTTSSLFATVCGALLAFIVVFVLSTYKDTIENEDDFEKHYNNITVLGSIPDFSTAQSKNHYKYYSKGDYIHGN